MDNDAEHAGGQDRREFLLTSAGVAAALASGDTAMASTPNSPHAPPAAGGGDPWYRRCCRWGQTNITEIDPTRYDIGWWRRYWKRTEVQGVIVNAGGIVAYYPTRIPHHRRAEFLGDRDLYGDLARAAHQDGLAVLARMDSNRAAEEFYRAHPDWFAVDASGKPYRAGEMYVACVNSPYYEEHIPAVLREIIERSRPEGITDNSWSGLDRGSICHCAYCARGFRRHAGKPIPARHDWDDPAYRDWIVWNYARRVEIWDLFNRVTQTAGGPDCLWLGMNSGSVSGQCRSFRDYRAICSRAQILMLDHQSRGEAGFQNNAETGKLVHGILGWDRRIPESMAMYQAGRPTYRLASKPAAEARLWMVAGFAGGIQPWWHHVGAYHEDRRMYRTAEPVMRWHKKHEAYLIDRRPVATVGVVWSQRNTDFYGRDTPEALVEQPWRGFIQTLVRARIPYVPVHVDEIKRQAAQLAVLILPNLAVLTDDQILAIRRFVGAGGGLVATGNTGLCDSWGDPRPDFALADIFGASGGRLRQSGATQHTYLRLTPELRSRMDGPKAGDEPAVNARRHRILSGFDETDILPFGGQVEALTVQPGAQALATFIPPSPVYPPETAWMRRTHTDIPALIINETHPGRVVFLPADIDRRYALDNLPDHGDLLANMVRWAARDNIPLEISGRGLVNCDLYEQPGRRILHVLNITGVGPAPVDELVPVGPFRIKVRLAPGDAAKTAKLLVNGKTTPLTVQNGWAQFDLRSVLDHEVVVLE